MPQSADILFTRSPVVEVALAVYFEPWLALSTVQLGLLGHRLQARLPVVTEQAPTPPLADVLPGEPAPQVREFPLFPPRMWFASEDQTALVQLQFDRMVFNWRRRDGAEEYPHYATVFERFWVEFSELRAALEGLGIQPPGVETCELTYVNHVVAGAGWAEHGELDHLFTFVGGLDVLPTVEDADLRLRFLIPGPEGRPVGRLHFRAQAAARASDGAKLYAVTLTARTRPGAQGDGDVRSAFDAAHAFALGTFVALTTPRMHAAWGRTDG